MNRILAPEIRDRLAAAVAIRLHPDRRVALGELVRISQIHWKPPLCRSSGTSVDGLVLRRQRSRKKGRASITSRVTPAGCTRRGMEPERTAANFNRVAVQTEQEPQADPLLAHAT